MQKLRYLEKAVTLQLNRDMCNGCGMCLKVCPHAVFDIDDSKAVLRDRGACMECGACAMNCQQGAISVQAGVGCAAGIINGYIRGTEPTCECSEDSSCCP
jgi:NAD-dependent dihydropyrimidine dehydrogenase PreA subunit